MRHPRRERGGWVLGRQGPRLTLGKASGLGNLTRYWVASHPPMVVAQAGTGWPVVSRGLASSVEQG